MITLASKTKFEAEIKKLTEALSAKEAAFVKLSSDFEAVKTELTEIKNKPAVEDARIAEYSAKIEALTNENASLKVSQTKFEDAVLDKSIDIVAAQGAAPIDQLPQAKVNLLERMEGMSPVEQRKFWETNREAFQQMTNG